MQPVFLFDLSFRHAHWAQTRQAAIGGNIANADTPGYRARDIEPFRSRLDSFALAMAATDPAHFAPDRRRSAVDDTAEVETWAVTHSGNSVNLEEELMKASGTARAFRLDMSIARSFHGMLLSTVRSQ
jgi:flagellar basal-body rod protein FlgB